MASRYPVTETERSLQHRALMRKARHIRAVEDEKPEAQALLKALALLIERKKTTKAAQ